jgi:hypothetical protein
MSIPAIAPSPVARLLLELEARKATGGLPVGGRRLVLTEGAIVEVRPHVEDASLGDFLVATGRLTEAQLEGAKRDASAKRQALEVCLRANDLVPIDVLLDTRRALWLDRFVRGLASEESAGVQPGLLTPEPHPSPGPAIGTLSFVLDALARRAGFAGDAERVGRLAQGWFEWLDTPQRARATQWADLGEIPSAVLAHMLFPRHPAAPSRIAALVRAGLARLSERRSNLPPPAPRNAGFAAPAPELRVEGPITSRRALVAQLLAPGKPAKDERPIGIVPVASWLPAPAGALNDPLDVMERRIAQLEQAGAPAAERARAWIELSHAFRTHFDAIDEAARASREAVAADPSSSEALELSASLCSAIGRPELAYAYASGLSVTLTDPATHALALVRVANYAARADKPGTALRALRQASELRPEDPTLAERYAQALLARGEVEQAVKVALAAAERHRSRKPEAARALLSWAHELAPHDATVASDFASVLAAEGYAEAAIAHIARAARKAREPEVQRRLWLHAAVRAEVAARPDLAADLLLEAIRRTPGETAYFEPMFDALATAGMTVELSVLASELSARLSGEERSLCLLRAAEARLELPGDPALALELCIEALITDPSNGRAFLLVEQIAASLPTPYGTVDALERVLREATDQRKTASLLGRFLEITRSDGMAALERWALTAESQLSGEAPSAEQEAELAERTRAFERKTHALEAELWQTRSEERSTAAVRLAQHLRCDPAQRAKAKKLFDKVLERDPDDSAAELGLESLLRVEGQTRALTSLLEQRPRRLASGPARVAASLALIHHQRAQGDGEAAQRATLELLEAAPKQREGLVLLTRIASELADAALERDALSRRIDAAADPRERARLLAQLARSLQQLEIAEATRCAELALGADPRCAEAALLLVEQNGLLDPPRRVAALRGARAVLGDTPQLMRLLAQACFGTGDARGQLDALETLLRLSPQDPFPALGLCALRSTGKDVVALTQSIRTLIAPERQSDTSGDAARKGLSRLWLLGQRREAAELSLQVIDALGEAASEVVAWSLPTLREGDDPRLARAVLERRVARARGDERRAELRRLAHLCRAQNARAAEARVYLRLLSVEPSDGEALERLATIYAETRELERLTAVLTLRLNLARTLDERRDRLLTLALASLELLSDASAAQELVRAALAPEFRGELLVDVPHSDLKRGVGLLLSSSEPRSAFDLLLELSAEATVARSRELLEEAIHVAEHYLHDEELALRAATLGLESHPFHAPFLLHFERLALELRDVATGREVYRHLADAALGKHGRRAILYRAARFLERAGALSDALEMAEQAFLLAPSEGAILASLTRYAHATNQYEGLVHALVKLADEPLTPNHKAELYTRAAVLCEEQLRSSAETARLYVQAYQVCLDDVREREAFRALLEYAKEDAEGAKQIAFGLRDKLTSRAREAHHAHDRVASLLALSELAIDVDHSFEDAASYAQAAKQLLDAPPEDFDVGRLPEARERLQRTLARLPQRKDTRPQGLRGASDRPADKIAIPRWSDPRRSLSRPSARETLRPMGMTAPPSESGARAAHAEDARSALSSQGAAQVEPQARRSLRVEANLAVVSAEDDALLDALAAGDADALTRLGEKASPAIEYNAKLCDALLLRARKEPLRFSCVRGLWLLSERAHRKDVRAVTSELLAHVDPGVTASRKGRVPDPQDEATRAALVEAREDGALSGLFTVLGHLFLGGAPLFRRPLGNYGVGASDFIATRDDNAFSEALREVASVLGVEYEAYLAPSGRDAVSVVPTYPPSVIVGDGTAQAPIALRFRLGVCFEEARPSSVLLATLTRDAMTTLLAAVEAAFGAADAQTSIPREAASLASELWRTLPAATQKQIGNLLRSLPPGQLVYRPLSEQLRLRATRVGLIASGALDVALDNLELDADGPLPRVPISEAGFESALREHSLLAQLINFALSDPYLALRSRESS